MAINYSTGTATDTTDLLDKLRLFLSGTLGWTVNRNAALGSGQEVCVESPDGDSFFNFRALEDEYNNEYVNQTSLSSSSYFRTGIILNGSDGYDAGERWDEQPGHPSNTSGGRSPNFPRHAYCPFASFGTGPFPAYHFFSPDAETCYVAVEVATNVFFHFGFGKLTTFGSLTNDGRFFFGSSGDPVFWNTSTWWLTRTVDDSTYALEIFPGRANDYTTSANKSGSFVRIAQGGFDNWATTLSYNGTGLTQRNMAGSAGHLKLIAEMAPSPLNGLGVLIPATFSLWNGDRAMPIGTMPGIRYCRMDNYLPGDEITIGTDVWKIFPWLQKGGWSLERAFAYLKSSS